MAKKGLVDGTSTEISTRQFYDLPATRDKRFAHSSILSVFVFYPKTVLRKTIFLSDRWFLNVTCVSCVIIGFCFTIS